MEKIDFEAITLREEIGSRGGGIEIDLTTLGYAGKKMTAYQNYLGGGILGRVASDCNIPDWRNVEAVKNISEELKKYFFNLTNPEEGWESLTYEQNQSLSVSAY